MKKELFNLSKGRRLEDAPLVYLHEHFKKLNKKSKTPLKNDWVWFSKEDIEAILEMIKKLDQPDLNKEGDGVRLYYGIYNKKVCNFLTKLPKTGKNIDRDYSDHDGHNTVFFVPTYKIDGEVECVDGISTASVTKIRKDYNADLEIPLPISFTGGFDVGNICPPPKKCVFTGSNL